MTRNSDGEKFTALGLMGGGEGRNHQLGIVRDNEDVELRCNDIQYVRPGDVLWSKSGGGGGVGDPLEREVDQVAWGRAE